MYSVYRINDVRLRDSLKINNKRVYRQSNNCSNLNLTLFDGFLSTWTTRVLGMVTNQKDARGGVNERVRNCTLCKTRKIQYEKYETTITNSPPHPHKTSQSTSQKAWHTPEKRYASVPNPSQTFIVRRQCAFPFQT